MTTDPTATQLIDLVTAVPGVTGIEPSIGTSLRALDVRIRRSGTQTAHFGLHVNRAEGSVSVEVCLDRTRPLRETVRDIQLALRGALANTTPGRAELQVRVQSLDIN